MANKFSNIKERVLFIAEYQKISKETFFARIGMTYGNFKGSAKNTPLNSDAIANILSMFPEISPAWLISGTGEMLIQSNSASSSENIPQQSNHAAEDAVVYGIKPDLRKLYAQEMDLHQQLFALQQQLHEVRMQILGAEVAAVR